MRPNPLPQLITFSAYNKKEKKQSLLSSNHIIIFIVNYTLIYLEHDGSRTRETFEQHNTQGGLLVQERRNHQELVSSLFRSLSTITVLLQERGAHEDGATRSHIPQRHSQHIDRGDREEEGIRLCTTHQEKSCPPSGSKHRGQGEVDRGYREVTGGGERGRESGPI